MATLIISYFDSVDLGMPGFPIGSQSVTTSVTSAATANIDARAEVCSLFADAAHYVTLSRDGEAKSATAANGFYLPANQIMWLRTFVAPGQAVKFSAITA